MISRNLDSEIYSSSNYNLITEDNIQKIISSINLPKVSFLFQTQFTYLVDKHKKEYVLEEEARRTIENISQKCLVKRYQESFVHL